MPYYQPLTAPTSVPTPIEALNNYFSSLLPLFFDVLLRVFGAFIIFIVGWLIALLVKLFLEFVLRNIRFEELLRRAKLDQYFKDFSWEEKLDRVLAEIGFWVIFVVFLMVAFDILGLQIVNSFIRQILNYLPKAIAGGLILVAGFLFGELTRKVLVGVFRGLEKRSSQAAATFVKWAIVIFSFLAALNEWGVATEIVNTLVMGVIFFLALAGGLAFGLGGQETAREILENIKRELR